MPFWIILLLAILFILFTISIILYFIQEKFIFHAEKLPSNYEFSFRNEFEELNLKTEDGEKLNGLLFKAKTSKGVVLFFHNHSGNINHWSRSAVFINNQNYDVLMMDYRGFGKSTGDFNEQLMFEDSLLWYNFTKKLYDEKLITVYGRGIGAAFAAYASSINNPKQLVLVSPIYSINYTAKANYPFLPTKLILKYKFETYKHIEKVKCNTYFFHGVKDKLVPFSSSEKLHELIKENSELYLIPKGNHYDLTNNAVFLDKIKEITK